MLNSIKEKVQKNFSISTTNHLITFLNPYSYLLARKHFNVFKEIDEIYLDGIALVYFFRLLGIKAKRYSFDMTSIAPLLFDHCEKKGKTIYFIGAKEEEVEKSIQVFIEHYPQMNIVGYRNGYIQNEWSETIKKIIEISPDFVIVGMGTPIQEKFLVDLKNNGFKGTGFTCGGFLHQSQNDINYYPAFFDKLNIRWMYRIIDEPKLSQRYFIEYPKFVFYFFWDVLTKK